MRKTFLTLFVLIGLLVIIGNRPVHAFQYASLPSDNLIQNPWFRSADCKSSLAGWQITPSAPWGPSDKTQDPIDVNCVVNGKSWWGFAARFADNNNREGESFYPNQNALFWQVVGPVNVNSKTMHFHSLIVAHRVNQYKAEIYGSNSASGPWNSVWTPFSIQNCLAHDCVNEKYGNESNQGNREGLWDDVTADILGSFPAQKTITQGYPYYKIEFLMNYPNPDGSTTGDVGGKVARVYFKVSGDESDSITTPTSSPKYISTSTPKPTFTSTTTPKSIPTPTPKFISTENPSLIELIYTWLLSRLDLNGDRKLNILDLDFLFQHK